MRYVYLLPFPLLVAIVTLMVIATPFRANAEKVLQMVPAKVFLSSGDTLCTVGALHIGIPRGDKPLQVMEGAYTRSQRIAEHIDPPTVDSISLWARTAPERKHTLRFVNGYGWCWQLDKGKAITVLAFCKKGYRIGGNGGMGVRDKHSMLIMKNGAVIAKFDKTDKNSDDKFRKKLITMVADDPVLTDMIATSRGRRDKLLRLLSLYTPATSSSY